MNYNINECAHIYQKMAIRHMGMERWITLCSEARGISFYGVPQGYFFILLTYQFVLEIVSQKSENCICTIPPNTFSSTFNALILLHFVIYYNVAIHKGTYYPLKDTSSHYNLILSAILVWD